MGAVRVAIITAVAVAIFIYSLERTRDKGYDFPIYYKAGQGEISSDYTAGAWVYSHKIAPACRPLAALPYPLALGVFHAATWLALVGLYRRLARGFRAFPVLVVVAGILGGGAAFVILRCGNITGILALMVTHPVGALLAGCVKPYLFAFVVLHAAVICARHSPSPAHEVSSGQGQPGLRGVAARDHERRPRH